MSSINEIQGYNATQYNTLIQEAETRGVSSTKVDEALLAAVNKSGLSFSDAIDSVRAQLPELPAPSTSNISMFGSIALPSPGAMTAALIVDEAAQQRKTNREVVYQQGMAMADKKDDMAEEMEQGAIDKFACDLTGAIISGIASGVSLGISAGAGDAQLNAARANGWSGLINAVGQMIKSGGEFSQSMHSAKVKNLEADEERIRTMMEHTKAINEAIRDLISKSLEFHSSMQANMNQTRNKLQC